MAGDTGHTSAIMPVASEPGGLLHRPALAFMNAVQPFCMPVLSAAMVSIHSEIVQLGKLGSWPECAVPLAAAAAATCLATGWDNNCKGPALHTGPVCAHLLFGMGCDT
jgi:hypothetical protein